MSYREKVAWLSLLAMAVTFGPYFTITALNPPDATLPNFAQMKLLAITTITQVIILAIGHLVLRSRSPEEARAPLDERDLVIKQRSVSAAYYFLIGGMILVGCIMPFTDTGWRIVNSALFMIVLSLVLHDGLIVLAYRRQS